MFIFHIIGWLMYGSEYKELARRVNQKPMRRRRVRRR